MPRSHHEEHLDQLRRAEHGSAAELCARFTIVIGVAIALSFVMGGPLALAWAAGLLSCEAALALILYRTWPRPGLRYHAALVAYFMASVSFLWLPVYLIATNTSPQLVYVGVAGIAGLTIYTLQRAHSERNIVAIDCMQLSAVAVAVLIILYARTNSPAEAALLMIVSGGFTLYYVLAAIGRLRQQDELRTAQQRYANAQKARALNQFVGGVAHDFNNQLTAVLGNLELAELLDTPAERAEALAASRSAACGAALTVQQLLASSGRTRLSPTVVPMPRFFTRLAALLPDLLDPEMKLVFTPPDDSHVAHVDIDMLETCVVQLCLNAQDATRSRGTVYIGSKIEESAPLHPAPAAPDLSPKHPAPLLAITVEDDGPGVPADALHMLAEPFYTTKVVGEGSGLGLSAVAGFARQSGGTLTIAQSAQGGLSVTLSLPLSAQVRTSRECE